MTTPGRLPDRPDTRPGRAIRSASATVAFDDLAHASSLASRRADLRGRSVLVLTASQLPAALALIELHGCARRLVICPPDLRPDQRASVIAQAEVDAVVTDLEAPEVETLGVDLVVPCIVSPGASLLPRGETVSDRTDERRDARDAHCDQGAQPTLIRRFAPPSPSQGEGRSPSGGEPIDTEWVLLTSGTTGAPKMVVHTFAGLTGAIVGHPRPEAPANPGRPPVWGTFYDIRRYGGLQIFLRAMLGTGSLVLSQAGEPVEAHLRRLAEAGVTHLSGTPSHWRRVLMSPEAALISPSYVRLSGEIADQAILDSLRRTFPRAAIGHAYASTEAGVGFEVDDGREGFPAALVNNADAAVRMKVADGSLRIRSRRTAIRYLAETSPVLADEDGFVDTDDMVELRNGRYYFTGRRSGIINVGGLKVHPEEVEAVINRHGAVRMSLVKARANPITGAIVVADVVLDADPASEAGSAAPALKHEILKLCREALPHHKVPVLLRFVPALKVTAAGKLDRAHA